MGMKIELCVGVVAAVIAATMPLWRSACAEEAKRAAAAESEQTDAEMVAKGKALYVHHCWHCHGPNMVNPGTSSFDLRQFPHDDKARFVHSVTTGKNSRMPAWGDVLSRTDIDELWAYIKTGGAQ
jgi:mono/diheme cytochrome c family protein